MGHYQTFDHFFTSFDLTRILETFPNDSRVCYYGTLGKISHKPLTYGMNPCRVLTSLAHTHKPTRTYNAPHARIPIISNSSNQHLSQSRENVETYSFYYLDSICIKMLRWLEKFLRFFSIQSTRIETETYRYVHTRKKGGIFLLLLNGMKCM